MPSTPSTTESSTRTMDNGGASQNPQGGQSAAARVAGEAPAQAARVAQDARTQVTDAAHRTMSELRTQADDRTAQASRGLRDLSTKVDALANGRPEEAGNLADVAKSVGQHATDFADRLDARGVQGVADDLSRFGRQHPWAFLGLSLGAGFVVGRLARTTASVVSDSQQDQQGQPYAQIPTTGYVGYETPQTATITYSDISTSTSDLGQ